MKILYCKVCGDLKKIHKHGSVSICDCGNSSARYSTRDYNKTVIFGKAVVLGIVGDAFLEAINNCPKEGVGTYFRGYVIPKNSKSLKKEHI